MNTQENIATNRKLLQLEISVDKLALLFESGLLCAAEIRCLTTESKNQVSELCLRSCAKKIGCNITFFDERLSNQPIQFKKFV